MTTLGLQGLRGGVGCSSLLAAIGYALQALGERVLLIDLCPENMQRLHCGLPFAEVRGWARADLDGRDWHDMAYQVVGGLYLLPYGRLDAGEQNRIEQDLAGDPQRWVERIDDLDKRFDWLLFDLPQRLPGHTNALLGGGLDLRVQVLMADAACHALLAQQEQRPGNLLLVNRFDPASQLQRDLLLLWNKDLAGRLLPQTVHQDEAVGAALGHKVPLGYFAAGSLAMQDLQSLATWCLTRRRAA